MIDEIDFIKVETKSFQDMCEQIIALQKENQQLKVDNDFLQHENAKLNRMKNGLRLNNSKLTLERNELVDELHHIKSMSMFEFGNTYCSSESLEADGHAFARALLGGR